WGEIVSDGYFRVLGVQAAHGRVFAPSEENDGAAVVVLGFGLWKRRFGSDPNALNSHIEVDGRRFRVVGIAPESFRGTIPAFRSALWIPVQSAPVRRREALDRGDRDYFTMCRIAPNAVIGQVRTALDALTDRLQRDYPGTNRAVRLVAFTESDGRV